MEVRQHQYGHQAVAPVSVFDGAGKSTISTFAGVMHACKVHMPALTLVY